jgi:hypothetical protein
MDNSSAPYSKLALVSLGVSVAGLLSLFIPFHYGGYDIARGCMIVALPLSVVALIFTKGKLRVLSVVVAVIIGLGWPGFAYLNEHALDGLRTM